MAVWDGSYMGEWRVMRVNPVTWADEERIPLTRDYSVTMNCTDSVPMLQSGSFKVDLDVGEKFEPGWYRIEMRGEGDGSNERVYLATLVCEKASGEHDHGSHTVSVKGRSVLAPLADAKMLAGEFINPGVDGSDWVRDKIVEMTPAPVTVNGSFVLDDYYVWDAGTSYLKAIWQILDAVGWCIIVDGEGRITVGVKPDAAALSYDRTMLSTFMPGMTYDSDYSDIPNRYYAVEGTSYAVATNVDPDSPTSYPSRGFWKDEVDDDVLRVNGESLQAYAERKLEEASTVVETWTYQREYVDDVYPFMLVRANKADVVQGDLRILSQTYNTQNGITVDEEAGLEKKLWTRPSQF